MTHTKRVPESALFFNLTAPARDACEVLATTEPPQPLISTEAALLLVLLLQDGHARDLADRIGEKASGRLFPQPHEIHWTLRRLERDGLIEAYRVETPGRHTPTTSPRIYRLTPEGRHVADRDRRALCGLLALPDPANASLAP